MAEDFVGAPSIALPAPQMGLGTAAGRAVCRAGEAIETWLEAEREQLALWLPVGLGLGIAAWFTLPDAAGWIPFLLASAAAAALGLALGAAGRAGQALTLFGLAAALGCALVWVRAERLAAPVLAKPAIASFTATVEQIARMPARDSIRLVLAPDRAAGLPPRLRVSLDPADAPPGLAAGARIALRARLVPPPGAAVPGAYDFARVAWFQRIGATGRALGPATVVAAAPPGRAGDMLTRWRDRLSGHIQDRLGGGEGGIAAALAAGDQGAIPEDDAEAMRRSGLAHLLSVSGLHLSAAVGAAMLLTLRLLALSPALALRVPLVLVAAAAGGVAGIGYTLLTGAEVPTVRSCIAVLLVLAGIALGRDALTLRLVSAGALIVLLLWPESLVGPSFQLSFAAITAIVALHQHPRIAALVARRDEGMIARTGRSLLGLLLTGLAVELALAPIALFHFHRSGLYGALANIVAIPLTTFVIMPLEALALLLDLAGLGAPLWWLTGRSLAALLWLAHNVAAAPGAVAALPAMPRGAYGLICGGGLWLALWRTRLRRLGIIPLAAGIAWAIATPPADILVTGDGRHLAVRGADGAFFLLRPRAGDYVRSTLGELSGSTDEASALDDLPAAKCNADLCAVDLVRGDHRWRLLATRSPYLVDIAAMNRACADADIVVSDRRLPRTCQPRWLKADRTLLGRTSGLAIRLDDRAIQSVAGLGGDHPWAPRRPLNGSGAAARQDGPARAPDRARNAADHKRGWPDRAGSSSPRGGNI